MALCIRIMRPGTIQYHAVRLTSNQAYLAKHALAHAHMRYLLSANPAVADGFVHPHGEAIK